jgi:hypothetical protein
MLPSLNRHQWAVLFAAWLGWGLDIFDGLLFNFVAPNAVPSLLGIPIGSPEAKVAVLYWTGLITALLLVGWAIGGLVFGALGALYASLPSTRDLPSETATAFTPELFTLQEPVVIGALLRPPDGQSWPSIQNVAQGRMSPIVFDIIFQDGQTSVVTDQGTSLILDHEHHGGLLSIPGLSQFGIRALFKVSSWTVGSYFQISAPLTRYPYSAMVEAIRQRGDLLTFMNAEGLLESFSSPVSAVQQVGALAAAIVRRMARETEALYGSFSVELPSAPPSIPPDAILFDDDVLLFNGVPVIFTEA